MSECQYCCEPIASGEASGTDRYGHASFHAECMAPFIRAGHARPGARPRGTERTAHGTAAPTRKPDTGDLVWAAMAADRRAPKHTAEWQAAYDDELAKLLAD